MFCVLSDFSINHKKAISTHRQWFGNNRAEHVELVGVGERGHRQKVRGKRPIILHVSRWIAVLVTTTQVACHFIH